MVKKAKKLLLVALALNAVILSFYSFRIYNTYWPEKPKYYSHQKSAVSFEEMTGINTQTNVIAYSFFDGKSNRRSNELDDILKRLSYTALPKNKAMKIVRSENAETLLFEYFFSMPSISNNSDGYYASSGSVLEIEGNVYVIAFGGVYIDKRKSEMSTDRREIFSVYECKGDADFVSDLTKYRFVDKVDYEPFYESYQPNWREIKARLDAEFSDSRTWLFFSPVFFSIAFLLIAASLYVSASGRNIPSDEYDESDNPSKK